MLFAAVMATVLLPNITIRQNLPRLRFEDFIVVAVVVASLLERISKRRPIIEYSPWNAKMTRVMLGMLYVTILSICIGANAFQQPLIFNDFMILVGIVRYWLILQVGRELGAAERRTFFWALVVGLGLSALVGVLQYFNLLGINYWLTPYYAKGSQAHAQLYMVRRGIGLGRVGGTHGDSRHYGYILVVGMGLYLAILAHLRHRGLRLLTVALLVLCLMSAVFTASRRTALSSVVLIFASVMFIRQGRDRVKILIGLVIVLAIAGTLLLPRIEGTTFEQRVLNPGRYSFSISSNARVRDLVRPFQLALEHPIIWLIGRGPSKAVVRTDSHNDFGWHFYRFGLPGLILYLLMIVYVGKIGLDAYRAADGPIEQAIGTATILLSLNWFIFAMAENMFKQSQLMGLNMWLVGVAIGIIRTRRDGQG
jgi:hypothetical protein